MSESTYKILITKAILVKFFIICILGTSEVGPLFLCIEQTFYLVAIQKK